MPKRQSAKVGAALVGVCLVAAAGCGSRASEEPAAAPIPTPARLPTVKPRRQALQRTIEQPARIQAFERTPLFAKIAGYVRNIRVEIGSRVRKGELLAELWVPELREELKQKEVHVAQARIEIDQAEKALLVARANLRTAESLVQEALATRKRAHAGLERWKSESARMDGLSRQGVIDLQSREETLSQMRVAEAAREEAEAKIESARAARQESAARRDKAETDVAAARNRLELAQADQRRVSALADYTRITAPFDGVVTDRHVDTGHFRQAASGSGPGGGPLFVVACTDRVRVFLEVPEADALLVHDKASARIRVQALNDEEFVGQVAGSSWSLEPGQRTLRTEIDFPNPGGRLRPGGYAHAILEVEQPGALTLPATAILTRDGQTFCWCVEGDKAVRTPVKLGPRYGEVMEVLKKQQRPARPGDKPRWVNFTGTEEVVAANPAELTDGQPIAVVPNP